MKSGSTFYITTTSGMRGYFAVMIVRDVSGYEEPYVTSHISCKTPEEAEEDGRAWAECEGIQFRK